MLYSLFLFGTYPFWILAALVSIVLFTCVEKIWTGWATFVLLSTVSVICVSNGINPLVYARENPFEIVKWVNVYALIGTLWSVYRWYVFLLRERDKIEKLKQNFLQKWSINSTSIPDTLKIDWLFYLRSSTKNIRLMYELPRNSGINEAKIDFLNKLRITPVSYDEHDAVVIPVTLHKEWGKEVGKISREVQFALRPRPRDHKSRITLWIICWPWSMLWYLLSDPIKRFANWIYRNIQQMLDGISEHVWKRVGDELPPDEP